MPTDEIVKRVFSSTDFLLKKREQRLQELSAYVEKLRFAFITREVVDAKPLSYMAIDGTESVDSRYDLLVFYAGAFGYAGTLERDASGGLVMSEETTVDLPTEISMAIPMHEGDVADVTRKVDGSPADVPPLLMELSELALARAAVKTGDVGILLLDRSLSMEYSHLSTDVENFLRGHQSLFFDDATIGIALNAIPSRGATETLGPQLAWQVMNEFGRRRGSWSEISSALGLSKPDLAREALSWLESASASGIAGKIDSDRFLVGFEDRLEMGLDKALGKVLFNPEGHPLWKDGKWVEEGDIKLLSLLVLRSLLKLALEKNTLLIGITKESSSSDFIEGAFKMLALKKGVSEYSPNMGTDLAYLSTVSDMLGVHAPWRSLEFDAHFHGESVPAKVFARGYVKLSSSSLGRVFGYDRPFYSIPPRDDWVEGNGDWGGDGYSDLVLTYLEPMAKEAIPEALGYNYPLFLADKKAKTMQAEARRAYLSAIDLELSRAGLPPGAGKYRDMRKYYEQMRRRSVVRRHRREVQLQAQGTGLS